MGLAREIEKRWPDAQIYQSSLAEAEGGEALLLRLRGKGLLAVSGRLRVQFEGEDRETIRLCPTSRANRLALNRAFPYTAPKALGSKAATFGFGDRLGYANPMQLASLEGTGFLPVLAQQSMRELSLMGRSYGQVIDTASWAAFRQGWKLGFAADGDHLKTLDEVQAALDAGCTMITLDCSLALGTPPDDEPDRGHWPEDYLQSKAAKELDLNFDDALLWQLEQTYSGALKLARDVAQKAIHPAGREIDFELSVDETEDVTSAQAHFYIIHELRRSGVELCSLAPRFVGEFQKAVDYMGDLRELRAQMRAHARLADHFGHKLSLHSASEKFSVFSIFAEETKGRCHVKTSGTSWLEAVECIAKVSPCLFRDMFSKALASLNQAKQLYAVQCAPDRIPAPDKLNDSELPTLMELAQSDFRQLMHITYGFILADEDLNERICTFMEEHRSLYEAEALDLYRRHMAVIGR